MLFDATIGDVGRLLSTFNVQAVEHSNRFQGRCPIHDGDNFTAFSIYKETGAWVCFTKGCHEKYGNSIIGLVKGLLEKSTGEPCSTNQAVDFLEKLFEKDMGVSIPSQINQCFLEDETVKAKNKNVKREQVRGRLKIPGEYFVKRGFSPQVLDRYDVGLCTTKNSPFFQRCVVPVYDIDYNYIVGYTGRDVSGKSKVKWLHSSFSRNSVLYNSWFAKDKILQSSTCILVESPGNIWRLEEAGIHCGVAAFGTQLGFNQMRLLSQLGALNLILLFDNDEAGKQATAKVAKKLKGLYNILIPKIDYGDVAECPVDYLQEKLIPMLEEL